MSVQASHSLHTKTCITSAASNGDRPLIMMKIMTPRAHQSTARLCPVCLTLRQDVPPAGMMLRSDCEVLQLFRSFPTHCNVFRFRTCGAFPSIGMHLSDNRFFTDLYKNFQLVCTVVDNLHTCERETFGYLKMYGSGYNPPYTGICIWRTAVSSNL